MGKITFNQPEREGLAIVRHDSLSGGNTRYGKHQFRQKLRSRPNPRQDREDELMLLVADGVSWEDARILLKMSEPKDAPAEQIKPRKRYGRLHR